MTNVDMSEAKGEFKGTDDEDRLRSLPLVEIDRIDISPNPAPLTEELNLEVDFRLDKAVHNGEWEIQYLVDSVQKRHIIKLGVVEAQDYSRGDNHFQFSASHIDVSGIQPSQLTNCGLLIASLKGEEGDIVDLKMVIQVSERRGELYRVIYNPLE